jgi:hypothetical protein
MDPRGGFEDSLVERHIAIIQVTNTHCRRIEPHHQACCPFANHGCHLVSDSNTKNMLAFVRFGAGEG